jgi:hypothetical protein
VGGEGGVVEGEGGVLGDRVVFFFFFLFGGWLIAGAVGGW